jgi:hypothetical protein
MISDIIKFLHAQSSEVFLGFTFIIAFLGFIIVWRRFRMEQYVSQKRPESGASEGTLRALLQEIQSNPQSSAPAKPVTLEQLSEKDRIRLEREVQQKMAEAGDAKTAEGAEVLNQLREKDTELHKLQGKIKELQTRLEEATEAAPSGPSNLAEIEHLQGKIQDLEARLKEYEIIEDDIADLSTYKEENARLREMLEERGVDLSKLDGRPQTLEMAVAPAEAEGDEAAADHEEPAAGAPESAQESVSAEPDDASTPEGEGSGEGVHVDADQLLSEVDELLTMGEESDDSSALDEDLNTDKLLQEASNLPGDQAGE